MQEEFLNFKKIVQHNAPVYLQGGGIAEKPWVVGPPAELKQILTFEAKGFRLPAALRQLLLLANGITLASNEQTLYSIEMILELSEVNAGTLKPGIYEFGCLLEDRLYIETSRIPMGNYIFYEGETFDEGVLLGYGMERFLDYLFASNFNPYWRWVSAPAETIHYLVI